MSKGHSPRPYVVETYGQNFDRIFRKDKPGVRVWRSDCCEAEINTENRCVVCDKRCNHKLVETDE